MARGTLNAFQTFLSEQKQFSNFLGKVSKTFLRNLSAKGYPPLPPFADKNITQKRVRIGGDGFRKQVFGTFA